MIKTDHPQAQHAALDLHGVPIPQPTRKPETLREGQARLAREGKSSPADRKSDRTARFYENVAPPAHELELQWRHGNWKNRKALVARGLQRTGHTPTQLHNFENCGSACASQWSESLQKRRLTAFYCHSRHCEPCMRAKANRIQANLKEKLRKAGQAEYRLLTLTLKHNHDELIPLLKKLYACFKKLRQTRLWKASQKGGAAILENKFTANGWHPHLHCVVQGSYLTQDVLSRLWFKITGDSHQVDVRLLRRLEDAAAYVTKYITKSTNDSVWAEDSRAQEWISASRGLRCCFTFGSWRKFPLTSKIAQATDWVHEDTLVNLVRRQAAGDQVAKDILNDLRRNGGGLDQHQCLSLVQTQPPPVELDDIYLPSS